jgi:hypothetical protein
MKPCEYCGRENDVTATHCCECGTPFTIEAPGKLADVVRWTPKSPLGLAFTSGLAVLLICTGIFFTVGRITRDILRMYHGGDMSVPASYDVTSFIYPAVTWTLFSLGALIFTFFVCYNRCQKESHCIITTIITLGIVASLTFGPMFVPSLFSFLRLVPVVLIGMSTGLSAGYYIGAALQIFIGVWLLGWFRRRKLPNNSTDCK